MARPPDQECGSCGQAMSGYSRSELEAQGWVWHPTSKKEIGKLHPVTGAFVCCDACEAMYEGRRDAKRAPSKP